MFELPIGHCEFVVLYQLLSTEITAQFTSWFSIILLYNTYNSIVLFVKKYLYRYDLIYCNWFISSNQTLQLPVWTWAGHPQTGGRYMLELFASVLLHVFFFLSLQCYVVVASGLIDLLWAYVLCVWLWLLPCFAILSPWYTGLWSWYAFVVMLSSSLTFSTFLLSLTPHTIGSSFLFLLTP